MEVLICVEVLPPPPPHPETPRTSAYEIVIAATAVSNARLVRWSFLPALRYRAANGSNTSASAIGSDALPNGSVNGCTEALDGTLTVRVTFVAPEPAAIEVGLNVALAPEGSPETLNWMACGKVWPFGGVKLNVNTACPPGEELTVDPPDPVDAIVMVPIVSVTAEDELAAT